MDPTTIVALAAPAVEMLSKLLTKGSKKPLAEEAQAILQADPGSQVRIRRLFETAKNRLRSTWTIGMFMTVALFVLFAGMALAAVITGLVSGKSTFSIVFGGASAASLFTVILRGHGGGHSKMAGKRASRKANRNRFLASPLACYDAVEKAWNRRGQRLRANWYKWSGDRFLSGFASALFGGKATPGNCV